MLLVRIVVLRERRGRRGGRWRRRHTWGEVLGDIRDAALERDFSLGGVACYDIGLCPDDVENNVRGKIAAELGQPYAHLGERLGVRDAVAEDAGVCAAVVETRNGAEPFLAG